MEISQPKLLLAFCAVVAVVSVLSYLLSGSAEEVAEAPPEEPAAPQEAPERPKGKGRPDVPVMEMLYNFDQDDPRKVVGYSENVFTGIVEEKVGEGPMKTTIPGGGNPESQFRVRVLSSIKAEGTAPLAADDEGVVNQRGGTDEESGKTYVVEGIYEDKHWVDQPLEEGKTYLFSTRYKDSEDWHQISVQPKGSVPLDDNDTADAIIAVHQRAAKDPIDPVAANTGTGEARAKK